MLQMGLFLIIWNLNWVQSPPALHSLSLPQQALLPAQVMRYRVHSWRSRGGLAQCCVSSDRDISSQTSLKTVKKTFFISPALQELNCNFLLISPFKNEELDNRKIRSFFWAASDFRNVFLFYSGLQLDKFEGEWEGTVRLFSKLFFKMVFLPWENNNNNNKQWTASTSLVASPPEKIKLSKTVEDEM